MKKIYQAKKYLVEEACIHTTATSPQWMAGSSVDDKVAEIDRWHRARGWRMIGYHRVIDRDGSIGIGRSLWDIGAGVRGHNRGVVHIALVGGRGGSENDRFEDHYTPEQETALREYLGELAAITPLKKITGHNQFAAKACPCFQVVSEDWMPRKQPLDHVPSDNPPSLLSRLIGWPK